MKTTPVEIRLNDDGSIDEVVAHRADIHIEQMTDHGWYIGINASDKSYWQFWIGAKNMRSHVEVRHTETDSGEDATVMEIPPSATLK